MTRSSTASRMLGFGFAVIKGYGVCEKFDEHIPYRVIPLILNSLRPNDAYICVNKLIIIGSDNGLSPDRRQAIISTNAGLLLIGPIGTNFSEILTGILTFSFKKMRLKVSSAKRRPFCLSLNVFSCLSDHCMKTQWCSDAITDIRHVRN